ncbi:PilX N-terminal domain-containing pilus assembly protein [Halopseudomonas pelagia]|uniref:PilX protein n=1 Tax=Halopseudomonas pelagia TaxID=553151 RepID=A0AA91Z793_9GAMM|nr:PilX N-terminal domain-containing pilus assembly protein [Halopseudomonas pelagia]PCD00818.1 PilX protein [Halopseudomonas pelagia]QFY58108.1 PilX protein [Halopseudomonas pelagia]
MNKSNGCDRHQKGAALLVALIMLLISTLIGLASIRGTTLNEKMSSNMFDRSIAYQAAESALRMAEAELEANQTLGVDCTFIPPANRFCPSMPANTFSFSDSSGWFDVDSSYLVNDTLLDSTPQYYIEKMGSIDAFDFVGSDSANDSMYGAPGGGGSQMTQFRITARSGVPSENGRSVVALQITVNQTL